MKSLVSIGLSLLLLLTNLGWVQTTHYCLGRPMDAHIGLEISTLSCGMESFESGAKAMEKVPGCCHDEAERFSLDQHLMSNGIDLVVIDLDWSSVPEVPMAEGFDQIPTRSHDNHHFLEPPPLGSRTLFLLYEHWLI